MKKQNRLGAVITLILGLLGIIGTYMIFVAWFGPARHAEAAEPGCEILLGYLMPALSDFGITAGVIFLVSSLGYYTGRKWAFPASIVASALALQGSWFINVPMMAAGLPPIYFIIFWPNLLGYFLLVKVVGGNSWKRTLLSLGTGMAFIFCFMNGVASWSRIITIGTQIFILVQRMNWIASIGFFIVTVGVVLRPREWMRVVGMCSGLLELVVGIPLVIETTMSLGRFSLFSFGPILSLILFVLFLWPGVWERLTGAGDPSGSVSSAALSETVAAD
jgi:hypothetical protein